MSSQSSPGPAEEQIVLPTCPICLFCLGYYIPVDRVFVMPWCGPHLSQLWDSSAVSIDGLTSDEPKLIDFWNMDPANTAVSDSLEPFTSPYSSFSSGDMAMSMNSSSFIDLVHDVSTPSSTDSTEDLDMIGTEFEPSDSADDSSEPHKQDQLFVCEWKGCTKKGQFTRLTDLMRHIRTVHVFPHRFGCPAEGCDRRFGRKDHCKAHIKRRHLDIDLNTPPVDLNPGAEMSAE
ncbi:hypothetical protein BJY04DRAFT_219810 [Aspergillus karnatakaensis]|uniref:uncharacterized protein n=1 Tax=Aspergillus karnatakaensis TaxID=1810916 RepID=UPI003CCE27F4